MMSDRVETPILTGGSTNLSMYTVRVRAPVIVNGAGYGDSIASVTTFFHIVLLYEWLDPQIIAHLVLLGSRIRVSMMPGGNAGIFGIFPGVFPNIISPIFSPLHVISYSHSFIYGIS